MNARPSLAAGDPHPSGRESAERAGRRRSCALDVYAAALRGGGGPPRVRLGAQAAARLPVDRWLAPADPVDEEVLRRVAGPAIDLGCGPGRHLAALTRRGVWALGVDISPAAVALARQRGAHVLRASVFDILPGTGHWRTALLLDGNVGIGGRPVRLLRRVAELLTGDGELLVELGHPSSATGSQPARIEVGPLTSEWFPWSQVSVAAIDAVAAEAGFAVIECWRLGGRWFARCARRPDDRAARPRLTG